MKLLTTPETYHDGEVHALDIDFSGTFLLTSGKDAKIRLWRLSDFYERITALSPISTYDYHSTTVSIVRWSPVKAQTFVSADTSGYIHLYAAGVLTQVFPFHNLPLSPIIDLSWSPDGSLIAYSTLEGQVSIYDTLKKTHQVLTKLTHIDNLTTQRSVSFDPTGNYLITLGDDTLIYLYQYTITPNGYKFRLINEISKLLNKSPLNVNYKRISWSPDGELLSIPTASKNQTTLISLISKSQNWTNRVSLVGHDSKCEVVAFNPKIFNDIEPEKEKTDSLVHSGMPSVAEQGGVSKIETSNQIPQLQSEPKFDFPQLIESKTSFQIPQLIESKTSIQIPQLIESEPKFQVPQIGTNLQLIPETSNNVNNLLFHTQAQGNNPILNSNQDADTSINNKSENVFNIIATAGSDKTLTVWNTSKESPLFVLKNVSKMPIVDLAWDPSGRNLLLSTLDGHIGVLTFEELELGNEISEETFSKLQSFGKEFLKPIDLKEEQEPIPGKKNTQQTIEYLDQKDAVDTTTDLPVVEVNVAKKVEVVNEPIVVDDKPIIGDIKPEILNPGSINEKPDDILHSAMSSRSSNIVKQQPKVTSKEVTTEKQKITPKEVTAEKQKVTTINGKKRIQPLLISNAGGSNLSNNKTTTGPETTSSFGDNESSKVPIEFEKPSYSVSDEFQKQHKRSKADEASSTKKLKRELEPVKFLGSIIINPNTAFAKVRLAVPKSRLGFQLTTKVDNQNCILDIKNGSGNETVPSRITFFRKEKQIWSDFVPRFLQLAVEGKDFWAVSTADGQLLTYSHGSGRRILPPLILGSPITFLESHSQFLMAVTSIGELYVWNITNKKIELTANITPLLDTYNKFQEDGLSKTDNITMCSLTSAGVPIVTLSNGSGYLHNKDLESWQTITESWWAFGSHYWDSNNDSGSASTLLGDESSIVETLEHKTNDEIIRKSRTGRGKFFNKINKNMIMKEGFENLENTISLTHLENRILCCELLGDNKEFHDFFITYSKRVCELGLKTKLYEICNQLFGPIGESDNSNSNNSTICGYNKHELLKDVIYACSSYRDSQRILIHFGKKIGMLDLEV